MADPADPAPDARTSDATSHDGELTQLPDAEDRLPSLGNDPVRVITAGVGIARLTVGATMKVGRWGLGASMRIGNRVVKAAVSGENATHLIDDASQALRDQARDLLGIVDDAGRVVGFQVSGEDRAERAERSPRGALPALSDSSITSKALRKRGAALLDASADVDYDEPFHPAYARILSEMAPDEARIVRLLASEGPQPAVDVRTYSPFPGGSQLIAPGLSMIGAEAGLHYVERLAAYLNNLERLGLVWFSREPLEDPLAYQVLEAQPDVLASLAKGRTKTVRRSIQVTPFGQEFAEACLPLPGREPEAE